MFEIFGALFGGAYLLGKVGKENYRHEQAEARMQKFQQWRNRVTDSKLEWKKRGEMDFGSRASIEEINRALAARAQMVSEVPEEDMEFVFGDKWREIFAQKPLVYLPLNLSPHFPECFQYVHEVAFNIWMSQKGYIVGDHVADGYSSQLIIKGLPYEDMRYGVTSRAIQVIERNIKRYHPELRVVQDYNKDPNKSAPRKRWNIWMDVINY